MNKKTEELSILNRIYKSEDGYIIQSSEMPDFIIKDKDNNEFGVEVTKMYYNSSSGVLHEKPEKKKEFLESGIPMRNKDELGIHKIYISINDEWKYLTDDIGINFKYLNDYIDALVKTIETKTNKALKYDKNLEYYELFIDDMEQYLFWKSFHEYQLLVNSKKLKEVLNKSPFKRIYFFTNVNKMNSLIIFGDVTSGPLKSTKEEIMKQKKYFEKLDKEENRKNLSEV